MGSHDNTALIASRSKIEREEELDELLRLCYTDIRCFAKAFFPERFSRPFSKMHSELRKLLDDRSIKRLAITAARGIGKSSLMLAYAARAILFRETRFIVWLGKTATFSELWTENLKTELLSSSAVRDLGFGSIRTRKMQHTDVTFSKKTWVASFPGEYQTLVLPRGCRQQVRGLSFGPYRPGLIIIDDLEDDMEVINPDIRERNYEWFYSNVIPAVPQHGGEWRIIYCDTVKHEDSILRRISEDPQWVSYTLPACDDDYKTLIPEMMPQKEIDRLINHYRDMGLLDVFAREYMCKPISKESAAFSREFFKYYVEDDTFIRDELPYIRSICIVDPAKSAEGQSKTAIVVWGVNTVTNKLFLRFAKQYKVSPDEAFDIIFGVVRRFRCMILGVEVTGLDEYMSQPVRNEARRRGIPVDIIDLKSKRTGLGEYKSVGAKVGRVLSLVHFYRQGQIFHNRQEVSPAYESQLLSFPRSKDWDLMDCAGYITHILDEYTLYFYPEEELEDYSDYPDPDDYNDAELVQSTFRAL